jgi:hypothetical protein
MRCKKRNENEMDEKDAVDNTDPLWCMEGYRLENGRLVAGVPRKNNHDCSLCEWGSCDFL